MVQKRKRNKKWMSWLILVILLAVAGVMVFLVWDNYFNDKKNDKQEGQTAEQVEEKEAVEKSATVDDGKDEAERAVEQKKVEQYDGDNPNMADELSGAVTYAGVSGDTLMIRVNIDQYLDSGKCELNLVKGGSMVYSSTAEIMGGPSTASCAGFDVSAAGLSGPYEILVKMESAGKKGTIRGEVNV